MRHGCVGGLAAVALIAGAFAPPAHAAPRWSPPQRLASFYGDVAPRPLDLATDAAGNAVFAWEQRSTQQHATATVAVRARRADGRWTAKMRAPRTFKGCAHRFGESPGVFSSQVTPSIAISPEGHALLVHKLRCDGDQPDSVVATRWSMGSTPPVSARLSPTCCSHAPRIAVDPDSGAPVVIGEISYFQGRPHKAQDPLTGRSYSTTRILNAWLNRDGTFTRLPTGEPFVVGAIPGPAGSYFATRSRRAGVAGGNEIWSRPAGGTWGRLVSLKTSIFPQAYGVARDGTFVGAAREERATQTRLSVVTRRPSGRVLIEPIARNVGTVSATVTPNGTAVVAWTELVGRYGEREVIRTKVRPAGGTGWVGLPTLAVQKAKESSVPEVRLASAGETVVMAWVGKHNRGRGADYLMGASTFALAP